MTSQQQADTYLREWQRLRNAGLTPDQRIAKLVDEFWQRPIELDIRYQDQPRYLQPAGAYWLQVTAAKLTGTAPDAPIWVHRLPSLIAATLAVGLTYWVAIPLVGPIGALIAALFMASSTLLGFEARLAKTDAILLAASLGAIGVLARAYVGVAISLTAAMLFWVALAAGIMVKGPLIALIVGSPVVALSIADRSVRWLRALRPAYGVCLLVALVAPWLIAITVVSESNFWVIAIGKSFLGKVAAGQQGHGAPPGFYLLLFWFTFWPAASLALIAAPWVWRNRQEPVVRFCLGWIVPTWIVFELVVTKLPHYVLPLYPAIAILTARALLAGKLPGRVLQMMMVAGCVVYAIAGVGLMVWIEGTVSAGAVALYLAGIALFVAAVRYARDGSASGLALGMAGGAMLMQISTFGMIIPQLNNLWLSPRLAAAIERNASCRDPAVASAGYHEPSLVFLAGTKTKLVFANEAADFIAGGGCRVVLVEKPNEQDFMARLAQINQKAELRERVTGIKIGRVSQQDIGIYVPAR